MTWECNNYKDNKNATEEPDEKQRNQQEESHCLNGHRIKLLITPIFSLYFTGFIFVTQLMNNTN